MSFRETFLGSNTGNVTLRHKPRHIRDLAFISIPLSNHPHDIPYICSLCFPLSIKTNFFFFFREYKEVWGFDIILNKLTG